MNRFASDFAIRLLFAALAIAWTVVSLQWYAGS
jgi:hypothetical protein